MAREFSFATSIPVRPRKGRRESGDVITSLNGERIRTVGELREKLSAKHETRTVP